MAHFTMSVEDAHDYLFLHGKYVFYRRHYRPTWERKTIRAMSYWKDRAASGRSGIERYLEVTTEAFGRLSAAHKRLSADEKLLETVYSLARMPGVQTVAFSTEEMLVLHRMLDDHHTQRANPEFGEMVERMRKPQRS